jgi:hypothetical protein
VIYDRDFVTEITICSPLWSKRKASVCTVGPQTIEFEPFENWRRRPDLNRGWRFCRFRYVVDLVGGFVLWSRMMAGFISCLGVICLETVSTRASARLSFTSSPGSHRSLEALHCTYRGAQPYS